MDVYQENGAFYADIWANKEIPALIDLFNRGEITRFLLIDYNSPDEIWGYGLENNDFIATVEPHELLSRDLHNETNETAEARLLVRDVCESSGLAQMLAEGDPFSDRYDLFG